PRTLRRGAVVAIPPSAGDFAAGGGGGGPALRTVARLGRGHRSLRTFPYRQVAAGHPPSGRGDLRLPLALERRQGSKVLRRRGARATLRSAVGVYSIFAGLTPCVRRNHCHSLYG